MRTTAPEDHSVDVGALSLGTVLRQYPLAKLVGVAALIFGAGVGAGVWIKGIETAAALTACRQEAMSASRHSETLQQALSAGTCIKSRDGARADAARALIGKLDLHRRFAARLQQISMQPAGVQCGLQLELQEDDVNAALFLEDATLQEHLVSINFQRLQLNDALTSTCGRPRSVAERDSAFRTQLSDLESVFGSYDGLLAKVRGYLKVSYLRLDPDVP